MCKRAKVCRPAADSTWAGNSAPQPSGQFTRAACQKQVLNTFCLLLPPFCSKRDLVKDGGRSSSLLQWDQQPARHWRSRAGCLWLECNEGMQSVASQWESSGALPWVRKEGPPVSWCHCISTGICSRRANHFTTLINLFIFFFLSPLRKCLFFFPLYHVNSWGGAGGPSTSQLPCPLLWTWPLCSIREAQGFADGILGAAFPRLMQIKQEPATHLVPNFSRERLTRLYGRHFCTKEFWLSDARSYGTVSLQKQEKLEAPMDS